MSDMTPTLAAARAALAVAHEGLAAQFALAAGLVALAEANVEIDKRGMLLTDTVQWYRDNEAWWAPQKDATEARYRAQGQ